MSIRWILLLASGALLASASPSLAEDDGVHLSTTYLSNAVGGARRISIKGTLGGRAQVELDSNTCTVNLFGDPAACTRMAVHEVTVVLKQVKLGDPEGMGRRLYLMSGMPRREELEFPKYYMVAPQDDGGNFRLIVQNGADQRRVIALQPVIKPKEQPRPCSRVAYRAEQRAGSVTIIGTGTHPSLGWTARFEQLPGKAYPPQFNLICVPPLGPAGQALQRYEANHSFGAMEPIKVVVVFDADGKHEVPVTQIKK